MKKSFLLLPLGALLIVSCAKRPESISASYISHERYIDISCYQLDMIKSDTRSTLKRVSKEQNTTANGDAWSVFLLGIPFSQLSGDREADVAKLKGEVEAIETAQIKNRCKTI